MNAAECLLRTATAAGIDTLLACPGAGSIPLLAALDAVPALRAVPAPTESVCAGAADGYARIAERPALVLLHSGPGLANAIANLHNARRACSPLVVVVVGDPGAAQARRDPPLASDIESLARPVAGFLRRGARSGELGADLAEAIAAARTGCVAVLIAPCDAQLGPGRIGDPLPVTEPRGPDPAAVGAAAELLGARAAALHLGGAGLHGAGLRAAQRIADATSCRLLCDTFPPRLERGAGRPAVEKLPYFPEAALASLAELRAIVFAGARAPVSFFGYPGVPSRLVADASTAVLAEPGADVVRALEALAGALGAGGAAEISPSRAPGPTVRGPLTPAAIAETIAALQPRDAIVVDESLTAGVPYFAAARDAAPHTYLALTGGAIGQGIPSATGAAIAAPTRPVLSLQADGSGYYSFQALWTQARESLDVTTLVFANRGYQILRQELERAEARPGAFARSLWALRPEPDWVALAAGLGVPGERVAEADELAKALARGLERPGPYVVEMQVEVDPLE